MKFCTIESADGTVTDEPWDAAKTEESSLSLKRSSFWPICEIALKSLVSLINILIVVL